MKLKNNINCGLEHKALQERKYMDRELQNKKNLFWRGDNKGKLFNETFAAAFLTKVTNNDYFLTISKRAREKTSVKTSCEE